MRKYGQEEILLVISKVVKKTKKYRGIKKAGYKINYNRPIYPTKPINQRMMIVKLCLLTHFRFALQLNQT